MFKFACLLLAVILPYCGSEFIIQHLEPEQRVKRAFVTSSPWPDKVVPYVFAPSIQQGFKDKYRALMDTISQHTCISFYEKADNNSDHSSVAPNTSGYVYIYSQSSCVVSGLGYSGGPMIMSPCQSTISYIHEFGHLLGIAHDQGRYERNNLLYLAIENLGDVYRQYWNLDGESRQASFTACDLSPASVMLYSPYTFTKYGWTGTTWLSPNQPEQSDSSLFVFLKGISIANQCCGTSSCEQSGYYNEGYQGKYEGTCQAVCPSGLDPATNCNSVKTTTDTVSDWPSAFGVVSLSPFACPDFTSFSKSRVRMQGDGNNQFSANHGLTGTQSASEMELEFCTKTSSPYGGTWGPGSYCFLRVEANCPSGLYQASVSLNEVTYSGSSKFTTEENFPKGTFTDSSTTLEFCCRDDGIAYNELSLPTTFPFMLFKAAGKECMKVKDMTVSEEYVVFDQDGPSTVTYTEAKPDVTENSSDNTLTLKYCKYMVKDLSCGGTHALSSTTNTVTINSPYPSTYGTHKECNWAFTAPEGSQILLDCGTTNVNSPDQLYIRKRVFGENAVPVIQNDDGVMMPVLSTFNKIMLTLKTGEVTNGGTGFSCTATLKSGDDLPYTGRGEDYNGVMNYAVNENGFHECLPWSELFEKNPEAFYSPKYSVDFHHAEYVSNYCRNPNGDRLAPFCATSVNKRNVTLQYCDTAHFIPPFDVVTDCATVLTEDPTCSLRETKRVCFKTCNDGGHITNYPSVETPASSVTCPEPTIPSGTTNLNSSSSYPAGTKVTIKCTSSEFQREIMCLSNGQWSSQENFCAGCPVDFNERSGNCYHHSYTVRTGTAARAYCASLGAHLLWMDSEDELVNVILPYRDNTMGLPNTKIWVGMHTDGTRWYNDFDNAMFEGSWLWRNSYYYGDQGKPTDYIPWLKPNNSGGNRNRLSSQDPDYKTAKLICKTRSSGDACVDTNSNCPDLLDMNPQFASTSYGLNFCAYTTGSCDAASCTVPTPATGVTVSATTVATGNFVHYECSAGYTATGEGNNFRACRRDGTLTGAELVCQEDGNTPHQLAYYPMKPARFATSNEQMMAGPSRYMRVQQASEVKACRAFCNKDGNMKLQFWKIGSSPKHWVLQSERSVSCIGGMENIWKFTGWNVAADDFVGVYDKTGGLVPYENCQGTKKLNAAAFVRAYEGSTTDPAVGTELKFQDYPQCYTMMVDCLLVPDTYTGSAVEVKFLNEDKSKPLTP